MTSSWLIVAISLFVPLGVSVANGAASVSILNPPQTLNPGASAVINTSFVKSPAESERRVVIRVDLHDADTDEKVSGGISDNGGAGYTVSSAQVGCTVPVPANASGQYYFKATVAPWSLNRAVVAQYKSYPTDGTYPYSWDIGRSGDYGVTREVRYLGSVICPDYPGNTTYCSGVAFETFVFAFNNYNGSYAHPYIGNILNSQNMGTFRRLWYGNTDGEKLAARAIPEWGAGREITDIEEAQEGDFIQLWRHSGSGHNPLFVSWVRNSSNQITGVRYWGSQGSIGISFRTEYFGTTSGINPARFYIGRAAKPRDQADYDWALGQSDTKLTPSAVNSGVELWPWY